MKEQARIFWNWFSTQSSAYLFIKDVEEPLKGTMLETLKGRLHDYCDRLGFEIGGDPEADQELIITAEGNWEYFKFAEALIAEAPELPNWEFVALIPPRGVEFEINVEENTFRAANMWFLPMGHPGFPEVIGIRVCIANYESLKEKDWLFPAISKIVEYTLGEKSFALNIHYVEVGELPEAPSEFGMFPLASLEKFVQWRKQKAMQLIRSN